MDSQFVLAQGVEVSDIKDTHNGFQISDNNITASVSFEKLSNIVYQLTKQLAEPLFFFVEVPCDENVEASLRKSDSDPFHKDVYYLDNCNFKVAAAILKRYGELLLNDGLVQFGFGSHIDEDEVYVRKYKVISIYAKNTDKYVNIFNRHNILIEDSIRTIWDVLSDENTGECTLIEFDGETIFDMVENLKESGMYFSHTATDE